MRRRVIRVEIHGMREDDRAFRIDANTAPDVLNALWEREPDLSPAAILDAALVKLALELKKQ